jgi:hypothetical protein
LIDERPRLAGMGRLCIRKNERSIVIKPLPPIRLFDENRLVPFARRHRCQRHQRKWHPAVAIEAAHQKSMLIDTEEKIDPAIGRTKKSLSAGTGFRKPTRHDRLLARPPHKKPGAHTGRSHALEFAADWQEHEIIGPRELPRLRSG